MISGSLLAHPFCPYNTHRRYKKNKIKYQMDILPSGGTDAGAMNISNHGVRAGGISIPTRNGHGPNGMVDMKDVEACIELLSEFAMTEIKI